MHLHFGFEHLTVEALGDWVRQLRRHRLALVLTVHDLQNPHLVDQSGYQQLLRPARRGSRRRDHADGVGGRRHRARARASRPTSSPIRTSSRCLELRRRPHRAPRRGVYVHAATCRPNLDVELITTVAAAAGDLGGVRVHVRAPLTPSARRAIARLRQHELVHLDIGPRLTDRELWERIELAHVLLLPYRWGTHSGLLETATDLGTPCIAPAVGAHVDQGAVEIDRGDPAAALRRASCSRLAVTTTARARQRVAIAEAHQRVYSAVLDRNAGAA